nr:histidine kinase [Lewinella sp. W8]
MNGLTRFVRDDPNVFLDPPRVHFESIDLFYEKVNTSDYQLEGGVPQFKPRDNHFNFRFRAVDLSYPERIRYRWKLKGIETSWSPPSADLAVRYAGLEPGMYQFSVAATTDDGKTWGEEAHYAFRITTQTWRKPWFLGVVALAGILLLIGTVYGLYRNVERRESKKRQALEKRNQLLKLEQQALRLQMNPHFIFNALNGIRGLVDSGQDEDASHQINRFASLMRGVLDNSRKDAISLAAEIKTLEDYLRMEQFCQPFAFDYEIQGIEGQDPEDWLLPPMILQPFVENAVLHGLSGRETPGKVTINFVLRGRRLLVTIEDDGIGRKAAAARREKRKPGHQSVALQVTEDRLRAMGGTVRLEDRQPSGTRVVLNFPVQPAW